MFLIALLSVCWATEVDYVNINEGEPAPFAGKLMTDASLAKMIAQCEEEQLQADLDLEYAVQQKANELNLRYDLLDARYKAEKQMYEEMIAARDEQIKLNSRKDFWRRFATYTGFFVGAATTVGIVYSLNQ